MPPFDLNAYLDRIGLSDVPCTPEGLRHLQIAQLRAIPFDALDPYLGVIPDLSPDAVFDKIIRRGRGGYCFEVNALLGTALTALGFDTVARLGRVRRVSPLGGPRSHLVQQVTINGTAWLVDAGFGGPGSMVPLRLDTDSVQPAPNGLFRLRRDDVTREHVLEKQTGGAWIALYAFDDAFVGPWDIAGANYLCATWDQMPFPGTLMLAGFDGDTRIGVYGCDVTLSTAKDEQNQVITSRSDLAAILQKLRLQTTDHTIDQIWARLSATI